MSRLKGLRLSDAFTLLTTLGLIAALLIGWRHYPDPSGELLLLCIPLALIGFGIIAGRSGSGARDAWVRVPGLYAWLLLWHRGGGVLIDAWALPTYERELSAMDHWLFGGDLSIILQALHHPVLTEIIQIDYILFYLILTLLPIALVLQKRYNHLRLVFTYIAVAHSLLVLGNMLVPARWPFILATSPGFEDMMHYPFPIEGIWATDWLRATISTGNVMLWDSMPSGHTCLTVTLTLAAYRLRQRIVFRILAPIALGIIFATVYLRYHYGVDIIAGLILALILVPAVPRIEVFWRERIIPEPLPLTPPQARGLTSSLYDAPPVG